MKTKFMLGLFLSVLILLSGATPALATVYYFSQDVTAYVSDPGDLTASGQVPEPHDVAVHYVSSPVNPIIPFGTIISTDTALQYKADGSTTKLFTVQDTGLAPFRTQYFFDIWFGENTTANYAAAYNFGVKTGINYHTNE